MTRRGPESAYAALDRRLDRGGAAPVAVALSGGGDSLALLRVAAEWAKPHGRQVLALTVDHCLNPESAAWTAAAGEAARRLGAKWRALIWEGDKPARGLPAAARAARHRLIAEAARAAGAKAVLFGHTADDVREAALMRTEDAPGLGQLREWSPSPVWAEGRGLFLLRPLLQASRAELRDYLRDLGETWLEDPANADPRFARSRARAALSAGKLPAPRAGAPFAAKQEEALARLAKFATVTGDGRIIIAREYLRETPAAAVRRFTAAALLCASGSDRPPRLQPLERLIGQLQSEAPFTATLAGARVVASAISATFARESGERARGGLARRALESPEAQVWDGRFEIVADAPGLTAAPAAGLLRRLPEADQVKLQGFAPYARPALPVLLNAQGVSALPRPFGHGPGEARALAKARLHAACGVIQREAEVS